MKKAKRWSLAVGILLIGMIVLFLAGFSRMIAGRRNRFVRSGFFMWKMVKRSGKIKSDLNIGYILI